MHASEHARGASLQQRLVRRRWCGIGPHGGASGHTRCDAYRGVFDHQATGGVDLQMRSSGQVHIGVRLAARHLMTAENAAFKKAVQTHLLEHHLDLEAVSTRSHRDAALAMVVQMRHSLVHAFDGGDAFLQAHIAALKKRLQPCVGERLS